MTEGRSECSPLFFISQLSEGLFKNTSFPTKLCTAEHKKHTAFLIPVTRKSLSEDRKLHNPNNLLSVSH